LLRYYETFKCTLDTCDFVPEKYNKKIYKYIFKNLKRKFREIDKVYKIMRSELVKEECKNEVDKSESDYACTLDEEASTTLANSVGDNALAPTERPNGECQYLAPCVATVVGLPRPCHRAVAISGSITRYSNCVKL
jgi:O6-methylguanine-DNA--protein-cysteine methyltransferase